MVVKKILNHRITKNANALILLQLVNYIIPLLVLIYLTNILGIETYGIVAFSLGIIQISWVVMDLGFSLSATQKVSTWRNNKKFIKRYIGAIFIIKLAIFFVIAFILIVYALLTEKYVDYYWLFILSLLPILGQGFQPIWFFSGIEKMKFNTIFMITAKLLFLLLVYVMVTSESDYLWVPIANGIAQIIAAFIGVYLIYKLGYSIGIPRKRDIKYAYQTTFGFFISRVSYVTYVQGGVIILGLFASSAEVAVYSLASQLYTVMQSLFMPINQAAFPYMTKEKNIALYLKITLGVFIFVVISACIAYFLSPVLIPLVFGQGWEITILLFQYFLIAIIFNVLSVMSGYPLAVAFDKINVANQSVNFTALLYLFMVMFLFIFDLVSPFNMIYIFIISEIYFLLHRAVILWPLAYQELKNKRKENSVKRV